jgi:hypothetical protein
MPLYNLKGSYEYEGIIEADSEKEAWDAFYKDLQAFYIGAQDEEIEELCPNCEEELHYSCTCEDDEVKVEEE